MRVYNYTADLTMRKTHTCCYCGAVYTYALKRRVSGGRLTPNAAGREAEKSAAEVWRNGAEIKPCPNCGRCQSEMFADSTWARFAMPGARVCTFFCAFICFWAIWLFALAALDPSISMQTNTDILIVALWPLGCWLYLTARLLPTFQNYNRNPERNLERMKTNEALRSELLGFRTEWARKQDVKRGWFIGSALWYAAFSFLGWTPLGVIALGIDCDLALLGASLGVFVALLRFYVRIKNVPDSVRFQGDKPLTTNASEEASALLREHWRELFEARETE